MNFQVKLIKNEQRRAVAPIIATLLMVAISVVGGILIFVFAQGFFQDTSIQSPTIDAIEIWGFNAKDVAITDFKFHNEDDPTACAATTVNQKLGEGECVAIFIRNVGSNVVVIQTLRVFGATVVHDTSTAVVGGTNPTKGKYCMVSIEDDCTGDQLLQPGQEATIVVHYSTETIGGPVKIGRPILIAIETGGGQTFTKQIRSGLSSGIT